MCSFLMLKTAVQQAHFLFVASMSLGLCRLVRRPPALSLSLAARCMSAQAPRPKGFIGTFVDNIKEGMNKDKQMKENLKKFREEKDKLEQSEALLKAREKFQAIEKESRGAVSQTLDSLGEKVHTREH